MNRRRRRKVEVRTWFVDSSRQNAVWWGDSLLGSSHDEEHLVYDSMVFVRYLLRLGAIETWVSDLLSPRSFSYDLSQNLAKLRTSLSPKPPKSNEERMLSDIGSVHLSPFTEHFSLMQNLKYDYRCRGLGTQRNAPIIKVVYVLVQVSIWDARFRVGGGTRYKVCTYQSQACLKQFGNTPATIGSHFCPSSSSSSSTTLRRSHLVNHRPSASSSHSLQLCRRRFYPFFSLSSASTTLCWHSGLVGTMSRVVIIALTMLATVFKLTAIYWLIPTLIVSLDTWFGLRSTGYDLV